MATIGFVRHGLTDWNAQGRAQGLSDIPLNAEGRQQAKLLAERLRNGPWESIVTSTLTRARETAEIIAHELGVRDVIQEHGIREIDCGLIEGTTEEQRFQTSGDL
ncbi:histidine phosphatase family protein [Paenibacillus lactis]|uniref:histidine phosphatase family protein n=1 Tax=Paenibacillus lactis TaxID=228574 RepID=UPI0021B662FE